MKRSNNSKKEYAERNRAWLEAKAAEEGVIELPNGIYYKVIASVDAKGKSPDASSVVTVNYTGRTIDGNVFDSSEGSLPPAFRLRDLIEGWIIALQRMHPGDRWEIYIPSEMGYGKFSQPGIPGGSTLIFDIELLNVM